MLNLHMIIIVIGPHLLQVYACLPARATTDRPICKFQSDCYAPNIETSCVYPSVDNQTKLLRVIHGHKPPLLFLGHPLDLHYSGKWPSPPCCHTVGVRAGTIQSVADTIRIRYRPCRYDMYSIRYRCT